jgi:hypothetical protein
MQGEKDNQDGADNHQESFDIHASVHPDPPFPPRFSLSVTILRLSIGFLPDRRFFVRTY